MKFEGSILRRRDNGGHFAAPVYTRHAMDGQLTLCGLAPSRLEVVLDRPAVQGTISNCRTCQRICGSSLGEER